MVVSKLHGREGNWTLVPKCKPSQGTMLRKKKNLTMLRPHKAVKQLTMRHHQPWLTNVFSYSWNVWSIFLG